MACPKKFSRYISTSNFEILESQTVWPIEVEKKRLLLNLTVVAWTSQTFFVTFATLWMYSVQRMKLVRPR